MYAGRVRRGKFEKGDADASRQFDVIGSVFPVPPPRLRKVSHGMCRLYHPWIYSTFCAIPTSQLLLPKLVRDSENMVPVVAGVAFC